jgi:hypothetical protein
VSSHLSETAPAQSAGYAVLPNDGEFDLRQLTVSAGYHLSAGLLAELGPVGTPHADWP